MNQLIDETRMVLSRGKYLSRRREHSSGRDSTVSDTDSYPELEKPSLYQGTPTLIFHLVAFHHGGSSSLGESFECYDPKDHWWPGSFFPGINLDH